MEIRPGTPLPWKRDDRALGGTERTVCGYDTIVVQTCTNHHSCDPEAQRAGQAADLDYIVHAANTLPQAEGRIEQVEGWWRDQSNRIAALEQENEVMRAEVAVLEAALKLQTTRVESSQAECERLRKVLEKTRDELVNHGFRSSGPIVKRIDAALESEAGQ